MQRACSILIMMLALTACKRKFTCQCLSVTNSGQAINHSEFTVKDKNEKNAYHQCTVEYEDKGLAVDTVKCEVKQ